MKQILLIICILILPVACSEDEKAALDLTVNPSFIEFDNTESTKKIYVSSNTSWTSSSNRGWCAASVTQKIGDETVDIMVQENTEDERIAYISFTNVEKTIIKTVKIIQKPAER
ncbi:MAG: hypothetical protein LBS55_00140 [Prevotellaceae bacterium]|jgi:hypothetical protein|nr:hypothetical protein [Prevotellaceae bacterium]